MPVKRLWFAIAFLPFWLALWTFGGLAAMSELFREPQVAPFLIFWLSGWAVGWVYAASTLLQQLFGAEIVRVVNRDLEFSAGVWPLRRTWRYRGDSIRNLMGWSVDDDLFSARNLQRPFWLRPRTGAVKFDYGADSMFLATGVDEPEGRVIAEWLAKRLPRSATELE